MSETTITKEVVDLDKLFPGISTDEILIPKSTMFSKVDDLSFLDNPDAVKLTDYEPKKEGDKPDEADKTIVPPVNQLEADKILNAIGKDDEELTDDVTNKGGQGRPKTEKNALTSYLKTKIEANEFVAFNDWDEKKENLEQYLGRQPEKSLHELLDANWQNKEEELLKRTSVELLESLPEKLQYAARYVYEGGTDLEGMFGALAQVAKNEKLDVDTEDGQIKIARAYLQATGFGGGKQDVIEEQIEDWKESNKLEKKAKTFKPDLDEMQKEQVEYQIQQQAEFNKQQAIRANNYVSNVYKALEKSEIGGMKIDKKTQLDLYNGLTQTNYASQSGRGTNLLGHLLEQIQSVKPDFDFLAEVTYHLMDREGFKKSIEQRGANKKVEDISRKLKTEQGLQGGEHTTEAKEVSGGNRITRKSTMFQRA